MSILRNDEIGAICRRERLIVIIRQKLFRTIGKTKPLQRIRRTTGVMRKIETLFKFFKQQFKDYSPCLMDMFSRKLHNKFEQTIRSMHDSHQFSSMTVHYRNATRIAIRSLLSHFSAEEKEFHKLEQFRRHFTCEWNVTFNEHEENLRTKCQYRTKCPSNLPDGDCIRKLLEKCYENLEFVSIIDDYCRFRRSL